MDNQDIWQSSSIGVLISAVSQVIKSERWSRWVGLLIVSGAATGFGYLQAGGNVDTRLTQAIGITLPAALGTWAALFQGTPLGSKLKVNLWDILVKAAAGVAKATGAEEKPPEKPPP